MTRMWLICALFIIPGLSCGVNTGNPTGVVTSGKSLATTLILEVKEASAGQMDLHVKEVLLIPADEGFDSTKAITISYREARVFRSGQKMTVSSQEAFAAGSYDRMVLVLDDSNPASLVTGVGEDKKIAIAPYEYYAREDEDKAVKRVQIVLSLAKKAVRVESNASGTVQITTDFSNNLQDFTAIAPAAYDYYRSINSLDYTYGFDPYEDEVDVSIPDETTASLFITVDPAYFTIHTLCLYPYGDADVNADTSCQQATYIAELTVTDTIGYAAFIVPAAMYRLVARDESGGLLYMQTVTVEEGAKTTMKFPYTGGG